MKVHSIHEDRLGNHWIGTRNGLSKFNGESFTNYSNTDGLIGNRILLITERPDGELVFITEKGVSVFDGRRFINTELSMSENPDAILVGTDSLKTIFYNSTKVCTYYFKENICRCEKLDYPKSPVQNKSVKGYRIAHNRSSYPLDDADTLCTSRKSELNSRKEDLYAIIDHEKKILSYEYLNCDYTQNSQFLEQAESLLENPYKGNERFGYFGSFKIRLAPGMAMRINEIDVVGNSEKGRMWYVNCGALINTIYESESGHLLIGSDVGLHIIDQNFFYHFDADQPRSVWGVIEENEGSFITHSFTEHLSRIDDQFNVEKIPLWDSFYGRFSMRSAKDKYGDIYLPIGPLYKMQNDGTIDTSLTSQLVPLRGHFSMHFDSVRNAIIGSSNEGISVILPDTTYFISLQGIGLESGQYYNSISQDINDYYWMTSYSGLCYYQPDDTIGVDYGKDYNATVKQGTFGMHQDESLLWLGLSDGLACIDVNSMQFQDIESVVLESMVKDIIDYNDSLLLIGAKDGLYLFNKKKFLAKKEIDIWQINETFGYTGIEPGFDCFYRDSKERIWITSASHLSILFPSDAFIERPRLAPNFTSLNQESLHFSHQDTLYEMPSGIKDLEIQYEACGLVRPTNVLFKYQLDDTPVSQWISDTKLFFSDLSHGAHTVKLWVGPTDQGLRVDECDQIHFVVSRPLYQRKWFQLTLGIVISGILIFYSINFLLMRNKQKRYAQNLRENQYLKNQILLSELNPHFIFNALSSIQANVLKNDKIKASNQIVRLSKLIRAFLNSNYRGNVSQGSNVVIPLSEELQLIEYFLAFEKEKRTESFNYSIITPADEELQKLYIPPMLIQPLVENAIKHGIAPLKNRLGEINVIVTSENDSLKVIVEDNGIGFEEAEKRRNSKIGQPVSLGTKIINERIGVLRELGYNIEMITSSSPNGSRIEICFNYE